MTFAFRSPLGGLEIVVDGPGQRCPLQTLIGVMVAAMAQAEVKVAPTPYGSDALQTSVVGDRYRSGVSHAVHLLNLGTPVDA